MSGDGVQISRVMRVLDRASDAIEDYESNAVRYWSGGNAAGVAEFIGEGVTAARGLVGYGDYSKVGRAAVSYIGTTAKIFDSLPFYSVDLSAAFIGKTVEKDPCSGIMAVGGLMAKGVFEGAKDIVSGFTRTLNEAYRHKFNNVADGDEFETAGQIAAFVGTVVTLFLGAKGITKGAAKTAGNLMDTAKTATENLGDGGFGGPTPALVTAGAGRTTAAFGKIAGGEKAITAALAGRPGSASEIGTGIYLTAAAGESTQTGPYAELGQLVRNARERKGLRQNELAVRAKVSRPLISLIELGERSGRRAGHLGEIEKALDLEPGTLTGILREIDLARQPKPTGPFAELGERIARRRKEMGLGQKELAERVNMPQRGISRIEAGKKPGRKYLPELEKILGFKKGELQKLAEPK